MENRILVLLLIAATLFSGCAKNQEAPLGEVVNDALSFAANQSLLMANSLSDSIGMLPQTLSADGNLVACGSKWWVSGFFPGLLWYLYEDSGDEAIKKWSQEYTERVKKEKLTKDTHDVGFIIFCSFGNGYRLTHNPEYRQVIKEAANSLSTRFNPIVGCIRSWDHAKWNAQWQYPVIIDNMMNLELLTWTADEFDDEPLMNMAVSHANKTLRNHYRPDYSCYHVVSYDTITGQVEKKNTSQGFSDESSWARGQSWGLYGFTMMYRQTNKQEYLEQANNIARFLINHPRLPEDKIPYWDYDDPSIPNTYRDASAAAIMCSALIELSQYTDKQDSLDFITVAEKQIRSLSSSAYLNKLGSNGNFILTHSVGHLPNKTEVDVPLSYADYYFVEALIRMKKVLASKL